MGGLRRCREVIKKVRKQREERKEGREKGGEVYDGEKGIIEREGNIGVGRH